MKIHTKTLIAALSCAAMTAGSASADVLAVWGFTDRTTETTAMTPDAGTVAAGVDVSRLFINDSFVFAGTNNLPAPPYDGYGFGNADNYIFLDRASFFDGSPVPSPRPLSTDYTSFGSPADTGTGDNMSSNNNAPLAFTVTAGAGQTVTIESLTYDRASGNFSHALFFQEAGAAAGVNTPVDTNGENVGALNAPVVINAGETKSFTILVNSSALDSRLTLDDITLNGSVIPEPSSLALLGLGGLLIARRRRG